MSKIGEFYLIPPDQWLFETHGDVLESKLRAQLWFEQNATYQGAEFEIEEFVRQWALKPETGNGAWDPGRSAGAIRGDARQPRQRKQPEHAAARHHAGTLPAAGGAVKAEGGAFICGAFSMEVLYQVITAYG